MAYHMDKEFKLILMVKNIEGISERVRNRGLVYTSFQMAIDMKENSKIMKCMGVES